MIFNKNTILAMMLTVASIGFVVEGADTRTARKLQKGNSGGGGGGDMCYAPKLDAYQEILMNWGYRQALSFGKPFSTESNGEGEGPLIPAYALKSNVGLSTGGCWWFDFDCWVCSLCEIVGDELIDSGNEALCDVECVGVVEAAGVVPGDPVADVVAANCFAICDAIWALTAPTPYDVCKNPEVSLCT